jgi:hypothetical protein
MSASEKIKEHILNNPASTNAEIARALDSTPQFVANCRNKLRQEGKIAKAPADYRRKKHPALAAECDTVGLPVDNVSNYWYKGKHYSIHVNGKDVSPWEVLEQVIDEMKKHSPRYAPIKYEKVTDGHLLVVDPADIHIGKLCSAFETGDPFTHKVAIDRVKSGVAGIIQKVKGFPIDKILLIIGNDILHVDNAKHTTTSGTPQDTELMWYDAFKIAFKLQVEVIEMLISIAPVHVQYDPSNHDYLTGFFLAQSLEAWFRNSKGITFNVSPAHRKYFVYGENLIGSTHGDGAKEADLGFLMAHESKDWNGCKHRYFYTHHLHHKRSKDYMSVCVETLRSPSGTDSWHHRNGYQHAPKAVEGFLHHKTHGQIARVTHLF